MKARARLVGKTILGRARGQDVSVARRRRTRASRSTGDLLLSALDTAGGELTWASAGHPPAVVHAPDGTIRFLDEDPGPPLRTPVQASHPEGRTQLVAGSLLVLYTDGLVECRDEPIDAGLDRLAAALGAGPWSPEASLDHLLTEVLGTAPNDDVALLGVRR